MKLGYAIPRDVTIKPSCNLGFIVKVGCAQLVAADKSALLDGLTEYLNDPEKWEKEYNDLKGSDTIEEAPQPRRPSLPGTENETEGAAE